MTFYTFANATTSIPLANLDANFATPITLGNTAVTINGTFSSIGNLTLNNATIASGNSTVTKETVTTITSPAATNLTIQSAGTTAITVDTSQNVGIGTTSPSYKLDVIGGIGISYAGAAKLSWNYSGQYLNWIECGGTAGNTYMRFATGNAEAMRIDTSGNVGIGTTSPSSYGKLAVTGPIAVVGQAANVIQAFAVSGTTTSAAYGSFLNTSGSLYYGIENSVGGSIATGAAAYSAVLTTSTPTSLNLGTNSTVRATIDSSGNVGIGTTSPATYGKLVSVQSSTSQSGLVSVSSSTASTDQAKLTLFHPGNDTFELWGGTNLRFMQSGSTERMRIDSSGRLLVGTTSASGSKLQADGTGGAVNATASTTAANASLALSSSNGLGTATMLFAGIGSSSYAWLQGQNTGDNSYKDIVINPNGGNLLVGGTTSLSAKVAVFQDLGGVGDGISIRDTGSSYGSGAVYIKFQNNAGSVAGSIQHTASTTVNYNSSSDYRLKEDVKPLTGSLDRVLKINPVSYNWTVDKVYGEGFIAHELQAIVPIAVSGEKDAVDADGKPIYQGVDYSKITPLLVAAIQELKADFDAYKASHP